MTLSADDIAGLVQARRNRPSWHRLPEHLRPQDEEQGYALQAEIHAALGEAGVRRVGYKVGSTSIEGQRALGLSQPVYAGIYDATQASTLREALDRPLIAPLIECEIAVVTSATLRADGDLSDDALAAAVASAHLACEIVDNRYGQPLDVGIPTLLTDDFFHSAFVLGPAQPNWRELLRRDLAGTTEIEGVATHGSTADVLRPLESLRWLVRQLGARGQAIGPGEIVLTGSLVKPTAAPVGARQVSVTVEGFGSLSSNGPELH